MPKESSNECPSDDFLKQFLEDELGAEEEKWLEDHRLTCDRCPSRIQELIGDLPLIQASPNHSTDDEEDAPVIPDFEVIGRLGKGGMGVVWATKDLHFDRILATKVIAKEANRFSRSVRAFRAESQIMGQLPHPNIVPVHARGELDDGRHYYSMKLVDGETLADLIASNRGRTELLQVFAQVCQAIAFAHSKNIVHRDIKPQNIMVGVHGEVQVVDWGIAKVLTDNSVREGSTQPKTTQGGEDTSVGNAVDSTRGPHGTPTHMPPEQAKKGVATADKRSDVFGLGAVLCHIITGLPPFTGQEGAEVLDQARRADLTDAYSRLDDSSADTELVELAKQCLSPSMEDRFVDAGQVAKKMSDYFSSVQQRLESEKLNRQRQEVLVTEERKRRKLTAGLAISGVIIVLLVSFAAIYAMYSNASKRRLQILIGNDLEQASQYVTRKEFGAADKSLKSAQARLDAAPSENLQNRIAPLVRSVKLAIRLQEIAMERATPQDDGLYDNVSAIGAYQDAFKTSDIDVFHADIQSVVNTVRSSSATVEIIAALDNWALLYEYRIHWDLPKTNYKTSQYESKRNRLLKLARLLESDAGLSNRIRDPSIWHDKQALTDLLVEVQAADPSILSQRLVSVLAQVAYWSEIDVIPLLLSAQEQYPNDYWINFDLAKRLAEQGDERAITYYMTNLTIRPKHAFMLTNLGYFHLQRAVGANPQSRKLRELEIAKSYFERSKKVAPNLANTYQGLAAIAKLEKDNAKAMEHIQRAIEIRRDMKQVSPSVVAQIQLADLLFQANKPKEAMEQCRSAQEIDPDYIGAKFVRAEYLWQTNREEAIRLYEEIIATEFEDARFHYSIPKLNELRSQSFQRLGVFHIQAYEDTYRTEQRVDNQRLQKATEMFKQAVTAKPDNLEAVAPLFDILNSQGGVQDALTMCKSALHCNPDTVNPTLQTICGRAYRLVGDFELAKHHFVQALQQDYHHADAHYSLGVLSIDLQDYSSAVHHFDHAISSDIGLRYKAAAYSRRAMAIAYQGRFEDAINSYEIAHEKAGCNQSFVDDAMRRRDLYHTWTTGRFDPEVHDEAQLAEALHFAGDYLNSARYYVRAEKDLPGIRSVQRFKGVTAAVYAAFSDGETLEEQEVMEFRTFALRVLREDLKGWQETITQSPSQALNMRSKLLRWKGAPALLPVRDQNASFWNQLTEDEKAGWSELWASVDLLLSG